jgi:hypothetical protein
VGSRLGLSTEKVEVLNDYAKSPLFSDAEKVALEYADAITDTHRDVDDELFARGQRYYDDHTIAELTMIIAWENASSRFKRAFRMRPPPLLTAATNSGPVKSGPIGAAMMGIRSLACGPALTVSSRPSSMPLTQAWPT